MDVTPGERFACAAARLIHSHQNRDDRWEA